MNKFQSFTVAVSLLLFVACTPAPTATPIPTPIVIPTSIATNTLMPTASATATFTLRPTATETPKPTATVTAIPTVPATPTVTLITIESLGLVEPFKTWQGVVALNEQGLIPVVLNRNWDDPSWSEWTNRSDGGDRLSRVSIEALQNSPIGPAYKYTINERVRDNFRTYAAKYGPSYNNIDWGIESQVIFGSGSFSGNLSLLNEFDKVGEKVDGEIWHLMSSTDIRTGRMYLIVRPPAVQDNKSDTEVMATNPDGAPFVFEENTPYKLTKFTRDGKYYLAINGNIVAKADIPPGYGGKSPKGIKSGAYGAFVNPGSYFLETPIKIEFRRM